MTTKYSSLGLGLIVIASGCGGSGGPGGGSTGGNGGSTPITASDITPTGSNAGAAEYVSASGIVGYNYNGSQNLAASWDLSGNYVTMAPNTVLSSTAFMGSSAGVVGFISGYPSHAALWTGVNTSPSDLSPAGSSGSSMYGISSLGQVGNADYGGQNAATYWNGTIGSAQIIAPLGSTDSNSFAIGPSAPTYIAGYANPTGANHATIWPIAVAGSPGVGVDINPSGFASSAIYAYDGITFAGGGLNGSGQRALIWPSASASGAADLTPSGATATAVGIFGNYAVGNFNTGSGTHAIIWNIATKAFVDLNAYVPSGDTSSALSIYSTASTTYVVGTASPPATASRCEMWTIKHSALP